MSASSAEERDLWLDAIRDSIKEHPFYDIITTKKAALRRKSIRHGTQHDIPSSSSMTMTSVTVQSTTTEPTPLSYCAQTWDNFDDVNRFVVTQRRPSLLKTRFFLKLFQKDFILLYFPLLFAPKCFTFLFQNSFYKCQVCFKNFWRWPRRSKEQFSMHRFYLILQVDHRLHLASVRNDIAVIVSCRCRSFNFQDSLWWNY